MPKLIIGIVAVMFLQIGFMAYLAADQQEVAFNAVSMATVSVQDADINSNVGPVDEYGPSSIDRIQFNEEGPVGTKRRLHQFVPVTTASRQAKITPTRTFYPIESNADRGPLKVVVSDPYANKKSDETRTFRDRAPLKRNDESRSRSVIARVIKKPFDWLKAVGAKLR